MIQLRTIILTAFCLLLTTVRADIQGEAVAATEAQLQDDYIAASLLIVSPSSEVYSLFGHCALRLSCPSQEMDYCFTFETASDTKGLLTFLQGKARGGFLASRTDHYIDAYHEAGRGVTQYTLNLTPMQKLRLWMLVDGEIERGYSRHYDYLHTQCTSMLVSLLKQAVAPESIRYQELPAAVTGSFRNVLLTTSHYPWSTFFWQSVMGPQADANEPLEDKFVPVLLSEVWQNALCGDTELRPLLSGTPTALTPAAVGHDTAFPSPLVLFGLCLLGIVVVTLGQVFLKWRRLPIGIDATLVVLHTLVALTLSWLVLYAQLEGTAWNWYLLAFNPLPQLCGIITHQWVLVSKCLLALMIVLLVLTPFVPQLDLPHGLLTACFATRLAVAGRYDRTKRNK